MNILFLGSQMAIGGAQRVLLDQTDWFYQQGHNVLVAFFYDREGLHDRWQAETPYSVVNLNAWQESGGISNALLLIKALVTLYRLMRKEEIQVVETFTHHANLLGLPTAWAARVSARIGSHHGVILNFPKWLERLHTKIVNSFLTSRLVVVSERVRQIAINKENILPAKITVINNGINPINMQTSQHRLDTLNDELSSIANNKLVLTIGRLTEQKGHLYLLRAIPSVLAEFPNTVFIFAGEGYLKEKLISETKKLNVQGSVRFLGKRLDIPELLYLANVFVLPSLWEGLPIALLEAMATGTPVITTNVEGVDEVIIDNKNGLVVPRGEPEALSTAITRLLKQPNLRSKLGKTGKKLVEQDFTIERMCSKYEALFLEILLTES